MLHRPDIDRVVRETLIDRFHIAPDKVREEAHFQRDLGLDSIDAIDLVQQVEVVLGQRVEIAKLRGCVSLRDFCDALQARPA